jgi:hypothetical protein
LEPSRKLCYAGHWGDMDILKVFRNFLAAQMVIIVFASGIMYQRLNVLEKEAVERLSKLEERVDDLRFKTNDLHTRISLCENNKKR